ncbi:hypothetical protein [uncultured Brevundimonas sp.]|uniref:hypothetical protein n=1 Tax=uncultured Brevundimonas sp. TaxID=213418 RepID=UPI0030EE7486|tara:strand:+ start:35414 stop:36403 length:990 start_codon:yes stop_codon:yes gene_type:complete
MASFGRLTLFTEGGQGPGLGHVARCTAYARHWAEAEGAVIWILDGDALAVAMAGETGEVRQGRWQDDPDTLPDCRDGLVIVDSYQAGAPVLAAIARQAGAIVFIDDLQRHIYPRGTVVHPAPDPAPLRPDGATWLTGPVWQPLRPGFGNLSRRPEVRPTVERILVTMGGGDVRALGDETARLAAGEYPDARIDLVRGGADDGPSPPGVTVHHRLSDSAMAALMLEADLAVSAAGTTTFELACCGVPTILVGVADNQQANLDHWPPLCGFVDAGRWDGPDRQARIRSGLRRLGDPGLRAEIATRSAALVDGQGVRRLFDYLQQAQGPDPA